jgi:hypothetical protein
MPERRKPPRKRLGYFETQDKMMSLRRFYMTDASGSDRARLPSVQQAHRDLDPISTPEPDEELEDSELSDAERRAAIARERWRREGHT